MAITLKSIRDDFLQYQDINSVNTTWFNAVINDIEFEIWDIVTAGDPERFLSRATISVVPNTITYSLPSDFQTIDKPNLGLFRFSAEGDTIEQYSLSVEGSNEVYGYYIVGVTSLKFVRDPNRTVDLTLKYIPEKTEITADANPLILSDISNDRYKKLYLDWIKGYYDVRETRGDFLAVQNQLIEDAKEKLKREFPGSRRRTLNILGSYLAPRARQRSRSTAIYY